MELWRAKIFNSFEDRPDEKRVIIGTENGAILHHVVQTKINEPTVVDSMHTHWSEIKEVAGKSFMMAGGFTYNSEIQARAPQAFLDAIAPFQSPGHKTRIACSGPGQLANVVMAPVVTFVSRPWIDTDLEKHVLADFVGRAVDQHESYFMINPISDPLRIRSEDPA